jgi:hypothetical protein
MLCRNDTFYGRLAADKDNSEAGLFPLFAADPIFGCSLASA